METKIDRTITDEELSIANYNLFRCDRDLHGGGIAVYVDSSIPTIRLRSPNELGIGQKDLEVLSLKIGQGANSIILVSVYIPRQSAPAIDTLIRYVNSSFRRHHHRLVICGDFNADLLQHSTAHSSILNLLATIDGIQTVQAPTFKDRSLLDLMILGDKSRHISTLVEAPFSDHATISTKIRFSSSAPPQENRMF